MLKTDYKLVRAECMSLSVTVVRCSDASMLKVHSHICKSHSCCHLWCTKRWLQVVSFETHLITKHIFSLSYPHLTWTLASLGKRVSVCIWSVFSVNSFSKHCWALVALLIAEVWWFLMQYCLKARRFTHTTVVSPNSLLCTVDGERPEFVIFGLVMLLWLYSQTLYPPSNPRISAECSSSNSISNCLYFWNAIKVF